MNTDETQILLQRRVSSRAESPVRLGLRLRTAATTPIQRCNNLTNQRDAKRQYRRRMLLGRILSSVRYFATVRRAIGIPRLLKISTISLSLNGDPQSSFFTRSRMASFTLVLLIDSPLAV